VKNVGIVKAKFPSRLTQFEDRDPSVVLASPGMLQSGLSFDLFRKWCGNPLNGIVFAGYSVPGTLAYDVLKRKQGVCFFFVCVRSISSHIKERSEKNHYGLF